ncbi:MAG: radical SAM protein [Verrucomicrobia bacterium]|nr:radical SAM protein [Verrucomicrobiota bacterium]
MRMRVPWILFRLRRRLETLLSERRQFIYRGETVPLFEDTRQEPLLVHIALKYFVCNFHCEYCYLIDRVARIEPGILERLDKLMGRLKRIRRPLHVLFATDGEITAVPELLPFLPRFQEIESLRLLTLYSNLSGDFEKILNVFPPKKLSVIATCHPRIVNRSARLKETFMRNARLLHERARMLVVALVLDPAELQRVRALRDELTAAGLVVSAYPLQPASKKRSARHYDTPEQADLARQILKETNIATVVNEFMMGKQMHCFPCAAGRDYLEVEDDGNVHACFRLTDVSLGSMFDEKGPLLPRDGVLCPHGGCRTNWAVAFSEVVSRDFKRVNSIYNFVRRAPCEPPGHSFEIED